MRFWIAEIGEDSIAYISGEISAEPIDDGGASLLVGTDDFAEVFGVEIERRVPKIPLGHRTSPSSAAARHPQMVLVIRVP